MSVSRGKELQLWEQLPYPVLLKHYQGQCPSSSHPGCLLPHMCLWLSSSFFCFSSPSWKKKKTCKLKEKTQIQLPEVLFPPAPLPFPHSFLLETIVALIRRIRAVFMSLYLSHLWVPVIPIHLRYGKSRHLSWCSTVPHCVGTDSLGRAVHSQKATFGSCG